MSEKLEKQESPPSIPIKIKLLSIEEVFVYRIPPLKSAGGHRAEDWDLAKPLKTCSLTVERDDHDACFLRLQSSEDTLFALCVMKFDSTKTKIEHFVESVVDSSRYFVVRISDGTRQASIGIGFREREDASNFRLALQDWERSLEREKTAEKLHREYENEHGLEVTEGTSETVDSSSDSLPEQVSRLTLKEGETIHVNIKGASATTKEPKKARRPASAATGGAAVPRLKKPPPSPVIQPQQASTTEESIKIVSLKEIREARGSTASAGTSEVGSECAVASLTDDEEWNNFEASSQY